MTRNSSVFRIYIIGIALTVTSLQVTWTWEFYAQADLELKDPGQMPKFVSGTVCGEELIFLTETYSARRPRDRSKDQLIPVNEVHCNLRTGRVSTIPVSPIVRHVVSDGLTLWRLPADERVHRAIAWHGRPVDAMNSPYRRELMEFADGRWKETDEYLLLPPGYLVFPMACPLQSPNSIAMLRFGRNEPNVLYNSAVSIGTKQQAIEYDKRLSTERIRDLDPGWHETKFDSKSFRLVSSRSKLKDVALGVWIEGDHVCALRGIPHDNRLAAFEFQRSIVNDGVEKIVVPSPIPWGTRGDWEFRFVDGWIRVVTTNSGEVYIVSLNNEDGRLHVLQWKDGKLRLVAQRGSPLLDRECRAVEPFLRYSIWIPMLVLAVMTWMFQRAERHRQSCYGRETVLLASGLRRGVARAIDLSIPATAVIASVVLHPDVVGWWFEVKSKWSSQFVPILNLYRNSSSPVSSLSSIATWFFEFYWELISVPSITWLTLTALTIFAVQTVWQGCTGRTLGKWLLGIRVLRTTLRPCGVPRSLLREILLILDSTMFLSWIPGVVSILRTSKSQRIGDWFADTIVVRDGTQAARFACSEPGEPSELFLSSVQSSRRLPSH